MSKGWAKGSTRAQRALNARILLRDGYRCRLAYPGEWVVRTGQRRHCMGTADCVHHTRGKAVTGDDPDYMVAACTPCNLKAGAPSSVPDPVHKQMTQW